ncbi:MAG: ATP-binding protein [Lactobacillus sp.]|jgi:hypothetical protein|nr:ATP-binding protein [Lactobacillus sp.]MCI1481150.1 ATP-binding protein [Lactobacillus sp.]
MIADNPFNPTFGDVPKIFLRSQDQDYYDQVVGMVEHSDFTRSIFISGVRGSGKTAFMMKVAQHFAADPDYYYVDLLNKPGIVTNFARLLAYALGPQASSVLQSINSLGIGKLSISRDVESPNVDVLLTKLMDKVKKSHKRILVTLDEVDNSAPIKDFVQVFNAMKRQDCPIFLLMTGLPDLILNLQNDDKLTFLLRSDKIEMTPLEKLDIFQTYQDVFHCSSQVAAAMFRMTKGYSYAFQLLGYILYEQMQGKTPAITDLQELEDKYQAHLFNNAYQKIFQDMSAVDQQYFYAICGHHDLGEIAQIMGKSNVYVAQYRRRALERHLIKPAAYGYVEFTLPYFEDYLQATKNIDSIFYLGL